MKTKLLNLTKLHFPTSDFDLITPTEDVKPEAQGVGQRPDDPLRRAATLSKRPSDTSHQGQCTTEQGKSDSYFQVEVFTGHIRY